MAYTKSVKATVKHDDYIEELVELIWKKYFIVWRKVFYKVDTKIVGEIDVVGIKNNQFDLYEVKSSKAMTQMRKAVSRLTLARNYLGHQGSEFIYTPQGGIESLEDVIKEIDLAKDQNKYNI